MDNIERAKELISNGTSITVLTGAGISTDSGIPDFRGPNGRWTLDPHAEKITDIHHYIHDPQVRMKNWRGYVNHDWDQYKPNIGHECITKLYFDEKLLVCITQNIDGLHIKAGLPEERVIEIHGSLRNVTCLDCGEDYPSTKFRNKDPWCPACEDMEMHGMSLGEHSGLLKPDVVFFGEDLNPLKYHKAEAASISCDVMLIVGTSLLVWPVADLPAYARRSGIDVIYVNGAPPPDSQKSMVNLIGPISELLPQIV